MPTQIVLQAMKALMDCGLGWFQSFVIIKMHKRLQRQWGDDDTDGCWGRSTSRLMALESAQVGALTISVVTQHVG